METVRNILANKGSEISSIGPDATVLEAARQMNEQKIGALLVVEADRIIGMFTERDMLQRVVAEGREPAGTVIRDVMTREVVCCDPATPIEDARNVMKNRRIRHLPVVDDEGHPQGMISIGDLNAFKLDGHEKTLTYLREYIYGRG